MKVIYFLCAVFFLASCYNEKKAQRQFIKVAGAYPKIPAEYCESRYPCVDSIVKGDSVVRFDTLYIPSLDTIWLDTAWGNISGAERDTMVVTKYRVCPPTKVITKTVHTTDTIKQTDKAALRLLQIDNSNLISQLGKRTNEYDKAKHSRNIWMIIALVAISIIGIGIYSKIKGLPTLPFKK